MRQWVILLMLVFLLAACGTQEPAATPTPEEAVQPPGVDMGSPPVADWVPQPADEELERGEVFIERAEIEDTEEQPARFLLVLVGNLPTPCHALRVEVPEVEGGQQINIEAYSVYDPEAVCTQVLQPFEYEIPLEVVPGQYSVSVNGEHVEDVTIVQ